MVVWGSNGNMGEVWFFGFGLGGRDNGDDIVGFCGLCTMFKKNDDKL